MDTNTAIGVMRIHNLTQLGFKVSKRLNIACKEAFSVPTDVGEALLALEDFWDTYIQ